MVFTRENRSLERVLCMKALCVLHSVWYWRNAFAVRSASSGQRTSELVRISAKTIFRPKFQRNVSSVAKSIRCLERPLGTISDCSQRWRRMRNVKPHNLSKRNFRLQNLSEFVWPLALLLKLNLWPSFDSPVVISNFSSGKICQENDS